MTYDSTHDTMAHIETVQKLMAKIIFELVARAAAHDDSKLHEPEKSMYDAFTPKLRGLTYGSEEYKASLKAMGPALQHHYQINTHHPEHYESGVHDMTLLDVLEMFADWKAASLRHADEDFYKSLEINRDRFAISDQLWHIMVNTCKELGW